MRLIADLHTHTIASTHAYSTLQENVAAAAKQGLAAVAITDHGVTMPGAPGRWYFQNLSMLPRYIDGVMVLRGQETNIIDYEGNVDQQADCIHDLDWLIASIHGVCMPKDDEPTPEKVTHLWEQICRNPRINVIGHCGLRRYPFDYERVIPQFGAAGKLVEINEGTFRSRPDSIPNCRKIAALCKKYRVPVVVDSDAHFSALIGDCPRSLQLLQELDFPEELVVNASTERLKAYLAKHTGVFGSFIS